MSESDRIERSAHEVRETIARLGRELGVDFGDADETRSPCPNTPGDEEQVDFHSRVDLDHPLGEAVLEQAAALLEEERWSTERESVPRGSYVYARRGPQSMELGLVLDGARLTLAGSSGCLSPE